MKHIASYSGGKDSTATVILAHEHGEPLDLIIFAEVMFDETTSGELPEHIDFIKHVAFPQFEAWGYECRILHSGETYMDCFNRITTRSKVEERNGRRYGFPMAGKCEIQKRCKIKAINRFFREEIKGERVQYLGIAADEPKRLSRLAGTNKKSLLAKYNVTEAEAMTICKKYGLLSPSYKIAKRGGCWFCPNARDKGLRHLRKTRPDLWRRLLELEEQPGLNGHIWNTLTNTSIHDKEKQFDLEDRQVTIWDLPGMKGEKW